MQSTKTLQEIKNHDPHQYTGLRILTTTLQVESNINGILCMVVHKKIRDAYNEYLKWFDNLGINREYIRETKIKNLSCFAQKLIDDDELYLMFGDECTIQLTVIERQDIFKEKYPHMLDILSHRHYDDYSIPSRKLIK